MTQRLHIHGLEVAKSLAELIALEIAPGTGIEPDHFWQHFSKTLARLTPLNKQLLAQRDEFQNQIDHFYRDKKASGENVSDTASLKSFLQSIEYLVPEQKAKIAVKNVDPEISTIAGPQLVVPVMNPRYALNAANARWGSLYDALYGSDVIDSADGADQSAEYNPVRGQKVVDYVAHQLDIILPLEIGSHKDVTAYTIKNSPGQKGAPLTLLVSLADGQDTGLQNAALFKGHREEKILLFEQNQLHLELHIDPLSPVGKHHAAGLKDVVIEAAITTIQDCEDSVAAVDAADKVAVYRNWLGLMQGNLTDKFEKNGRLVERQLNPDRFYIGVNGQPLKLSGRSLMLVRNVGLLMTTDAVLLNDKPVFEGILDGFMTCFAALHDLKVRGPYKNSNTGSIYIVKPKMHGPEEVAFTVELFAAIEACFGLPKNTVKMGIMDEERRTTLNLGACIAAARERVIFINTGFLDRTGDEIHTCMEAGPVVRKNDMRNQNWIHAYERWNVDHGLSAGMRQQAQIGKGMWPKPDLMAAMMQTKAEHLQAGANCAWVPSPTAAALHALHYHHINVAQVQQQLESREFQSIDELLQIPVVQNPDWSAKDIRQELENNAQGILGYVTRWIQHGIGCSKVPDINDIGLMEDRATLRISSQHIANWMHHNVCSTDEVMDVMRRMAEVVDRQNQHDPAYEPMAPDFDQSIAFKAACDLVFKGRSQPSGYTEPLLHSYRQIFKAQGNH